MNANPERIDDWAEHFKNTEAPKPYLACVVASGYDLACSCGAGWRITCIEDTECPGCGAEYTTGAGDFDDVEHAR